MKNEKPPSNSEIAKLARFWYPALTHAMGMAERDTLATAMMLGNLRKTERANVFHAAARKSLWALCDSAPGLLTSVEEPEGQGLDYVIMDDQDKVQFCLRLGKANGDSVRRNDTVRQGSIQEQGILFPEMDASVGLAVVTLMYSVNDDFTEAGIPQWWMSRLHLAREQSEGSEFIEEVAVFQKPVRKTHSDEASSPRLVAWQDECEELRRIAERIKRKLA